jgi:hypothetical protein
MAEDSDALLKKKNIPSGHARSPSKVGGAQDEDLEDNEEELQIGEEIKESEVRAPKAVMVHTGSDQTKAGG